MILIGNKFKEGVGWGGLKSGHTYKGIPHLFNGEGGVLINIGIYAEGTGL